MAFEDFDQVTERRKNEKKAQLKKKIYIAVGSTLLLLAIIGAAVGGYFALRKTDNGKDKTDRTSGVNHSKKIIETMCEATDYKNTCEGSLRKSVGDSPTPPPSDLLKFAIKATSDELTNAINKTNELRFNTPEEKGAFEDCKVLLEDALEELNFSVSTLDNKKLTTFTEIEPDLNNWLSAVMSYKQTCIDGFSEGKLKTDIKNLLKTTNEMTSNGLAIVKEVSSILSTFGRPSEKTARHLLGSEGLPSWMSNDDKRRVLREDKDDKLTPNVTVAKDGSGNYTTINEALKALPEKYEGRYVIYVKEGIYDEQVTVTKKMPNITMYGEGSQKTMITGDKNFVDGVSTFKTASFVALGDRFMAQSIGFRNTAGAEKHQAVALRVQSDRSIFLNCRMDGFQDTLYAQTHRQFYRSCYITGTIDFIFGDAAAVFQNCAIFIRKPMDNQQNIVTAQGRVDKHETTGFVLQNCKINPNDELKPLKLQFKNYLGRPWKEYSRTIVMQTEISDIIQPEGWMKWSGDFGLKTLYYAEYDNKGPGADTSARVKWPGYKVITKEEAEKYTLGPFIQGDSWLTGLNVPARYGLF